MKLIRFGEPGQERPGLLLPTGRRVDASGVVADYNESFFVDGGLEHLRSWARSEAEHAPTVSDDRRLGPPISRPSKIVCIGLNFMDHARESDMAVPDEPVIFFKAPSALSGPYDDVVMPPESTKTDWELELAVVIGARASYVSESEAMEYVAGYTIHNDYSERDYQLERGGQWVKGKSFDTFAPMGPFLATPDEIDDLNQLDLRLWVNDELKQGGSTSSFIFGVPKLVSYLSHHMSLLPGDVISTGTPAGVGLGQDPPEFLEAGDVVELEIDGLGTARLHLRATPSSVSSR